ncbi:MAG: type II secretion system GspH family protein [Defluviitaleaceae bacterium]|nr:type II secretion system GspH family protein [Defluviitaleaceae bacterium]
MMKIMKQIIDNKKSKKNKNQKGFTLVEIIVVVGLIALLSGLAMVAFSNISDQITQQAILSDAQQIAHAINNRNASPGTPSDERITAGSGVALPSTYRDGLELGGGAYRLRFSIHEEAIMYPMHFDVVLESEARANSALEMVINGGSEDEPFWVANRDGTVGDGGTTNVITDDD